MTEIVVRRAGGWHDALRSYKVMVDGQEVAKIGRDAEVSVPVSPGRHIVQFSINWCRSPALEVTVPEGGRETVDCGPNCKMFLELLYITIWRNDYIWARRAGAAA